MKTVLRVRLRESQSIDFSSEGCQTMTVGERGIDSMTLEGDWLTVRMTRKGEPVVAMIHGAATATVLLGPENEVGKRGPGRPRKEPG